MMAIRAPWSRGAVARIPAYLFFVRRIKVRDSNFDRIPDEPLPQYSINSQNSMSATSGGCDARCLQVIYLEHPMGSDSIGDVSRLLMYVLSIAFKVCNIIFLSRHDH